MLANEHRSINIIQGEFHVSDREGDMLTTILGSCVAACVFDPVRKIGGINHFLLPGTDPRDGQNIKYGAYAMEQLINALLRAGASRSRLEAKVFGGARVVQSLSNIGQNNADFALKFLKDEGIRVTSQSLGGNQGRRVRFWPTSGRAQVLMLDSTFADPVKPAAVRRPPPVAEVAGEVDLF